MMPINVLSLFDGCRTGYLALQDAGIPVNQYFASEIDKYAIKIGNKHFPDTVNLGDVCGVRAASLPKIDLLIGGSPCRGFSFAGKRLNFDNPRSALFWEYVRVLKELREASPDVLFLLENVRMDKRSELVISRALGINPIPVNSALVSAQNRERLYWTNIGTTTDMFGNAIPGIGQPKDKGIYLKDILHGGEYGAVKNEVGRWRKVLKSSCLDANYYKGIGCHQARTAVYDNGKHRKLSPVECERLQTLPDNYTEGVSDTQRYKILGNGWTKDAIAHFFKHIK